MIRVGTAIAVFDGDAFIVGPVTRIRLGNMYLDATTPLADAVEVELMGTWYPVDEVQDLAPVLAIVFGVA